MNDINDKTRNYDHVIAKQNQLFVCEKELEIYRELFNKIFFISLISTSII
jgi:hypothetical protein